MLPTVAYLRLWENQWSSGGGDALTPQDIAAAFQDDLEPMTGHEPGWLFVGGIDLGLTRDGSSVVVIGVPDGGRAGKLRLAHHKLWRPTLGKKIDLLDVQQHVLELDRQFGLEQVGFDPWQAEHLAQTLEADSEHRRRNSRRRLWSLPWMREIPPSASNLREQATLTIESFTDRRLLLFPCEPLHRDLHKVRVEEKSYGIRLTSPRDGEGHGDSFSAFALALLVGSELSTKRPTTAGVVRSDGQSKYQQYLDSVAERQEAHQQRMGFLHEAGSDNTQELARKALKKMFGPTYRR